MSLKRYLKDHYMFLLVQGILALMFVAVLDLFHPGWQLQALMVFTVMVLSVLILMADYIPRKKYYNDLKEILEHLEPKRLVVELIDRPTFMDGRILYETLQSVTKSMNDQMARIEIDREEYQQYVETWVHEIKTPITTAELICKNYPQERSQQMQAEIKRIKYYVEQALYYARSVAPEKDTFIRSEQLSSIVRQAVKNNADQLILLHCTPQFNNLSIEVYTDSKWTTFIIDQLIRNSIQYHQNPMSLEFSAVEFDDYAVLYVKDNGIGIPASDLPRVFDKGFTGENGRNHGKSTGIGLYLCHTLCNKLNLRMTVESTRLEGTCFKIYFPKNKLILLKD